VHTNGFSPKQILACAHDFYNCFTISYEHQKTYFAHTVKKREYNVFCTQNQKKSILRKNNSLFIRIGNTKNIQDTIDTKDIRLKITV